MRYREMLALPGLLVVAIAVAGCGGGSTTLTPQSPSATPTHAPTTAPTAAPTTVPTATATPTTAPTTTPTTTPTPSPAPTATATSTAIVLNPTSVAVAQMGSGCSTTATFQASEANYTGSFSAVSNNTSIATVTPTQAPGQSFTVTSGATAQPLQSTTITVSDTLGHTASEVVSISICLP